MNVDLKKSKKFMEIYLAGKPNVIFHSKLVARKALELGKRIKEKGFNIDLELIEAGAYLHDIGRSVTHGVNHAIESGKICKSLGFKEPLIRLIERHVGAGITEEEAKKLGLPSKSFVPETLEEKIIAYADKFFGSKLFFKTLKGEQIVERKEVEYDSIEPTLKKFRESFGKNSPIVLRLEKLREEIDSFLKN